MRRIMRVLGALLLVLAAAGPGRAVPLSDLLNGQTLTVGDKLFDRWGLFDLGSPDQFDPANIDVTGIDDAFNPGVMLNLGKEWEVAGDNGIFLILDFYVSVLDPAMLIKDMSSALHSFSVRNGGVIDVYEAVYANISPYGLNVIGNIYLLGSFPDSSPFGSTDFLEFTPAITAPDDDIPDPQREIYVYNLILVRGYADVDSAALGSLSYRFSQTQAVVPEPGTAVLLGSGLLVAVLVRRKKK